jgi:transcriptional regulator with XRE-family HTH domain
MQKLKILRESQTLSIRDIASAAGVSPNTIARIEGGKTETKVRWVTQRKIAKALGIKPSDIDFT